MEPPIGGTECTLFIRLARAAGFVNIFSIYAPALSSPEVIKDHFYNELDTQIGRIPQSEPLLLLYDFNACVGSDHQSWPSCIGHHGVGKLNNNGQAAGVVYISQPLRHQHLLPVQAPPQSVLETPKVSLLAPTGPFSPKTLSPEHRPGNKKLPQCRLPH